MSRNTVELLRPSKSFVGLKRVFVTLFVSLIYGYKPMVKIDIQSLILTWITKYICRDYTVDVTATFKGHIFTIYYTIYRLVPIKKDYKTKYKKNA